MKSKTTLILFAVALALGLWIKFYESQRPNTEEAQRRAGKVLNFDKADLDGIVIQNGDDRIELKRADEKWRLETPIKDQADRTAIDTLISDLEDWTKDDTIPAKEMDKSGLAEYDLVRPKLRLKLLGKKMPAELFFGKDAALENRMYVRFDNSKDALLVRQTIRNEIAKKPEDFRDRKLTDLAAGQVERIVLKTSAGEMELQKTGDSWDITKPLRARADAQKINDLVAEITGARIAQFVAADRGDLQPFGLAEPRGSLTLFARDNKQGQQLQIGAAAEKTPDQIYVRFAPRGFVYTLPKKIESILQTMPAALRDRHLIRVDQNNLDRVTIAAPDKPKIVLARKEQTWAIASMNNQPANAAEVNRLLDGLRDEQVTQFVDDVASDLPKYGLDRPQLTLTFSSFASENTAETKAGEHPFATVSFGKTEGDDVYARVGDEPFIVAVRKAFLEEIFTDPLRWQELALFKFKPDEVHRLAVSADKEFVLTRGPSKEWTGAGPLNQSNVQSLLATLTALRAVRWTGAETPPQAFDKAQTTITFTTSPDDKSVHKLIIGGPAGKGMWYGKIEGRDGVFVVNNPDFNALRLPLLETAAPSPTPSPSATP